jgi:hypothetical protein
MMRAGLSAILLLLAGAIVPAGAGAARAEAAPPAMAAVVAGKPHGLSAQEFSAQSRKVLHRAPHRVRVYGGSAGPGPNSVRVCNAHYEQEHRPSGTVIVPRMHCYWRG